MITDSNRKQQKESQKRGVAKGEETAHYYLTQSEIAELWGVSPQAVSIAASKLGLKGYRYRNKACYPPSEVRKLMLSRGYKYDSMTYAFQSLKGGSSKTSSLTMIAHRLNQYGAKVLCFETDGQGNLSDAFGVDAAELPVLYHVVNGEAKLEETVINIDDGLDLIPSNFENSMLELSITSKHRDLRSFFAQFLKKVASGYDFVLVDCNPALSALNASIALAVDRIIIPVNPDKFSCRGLEKSLEELGRLSDEYQKKLEYKLLYTMFDAREATSQSYLIEYGSKHKDRLFSSVVRRNADVKNAIDQKKSIFEFSRAPAREDFDLITREILGWRGLSNA